MTRSIYYLLPPIALTAGLLTYQWAHHSGPAAQRAEIRTTLEGATLLPENFRQVPVFSMHDQYGHKADRELFSGRWSLVFAGYTSCPDVCPGSMAILRKVRQLIGEQTALPVPQIIFISVDPQRDTQAQLQAYLQYFDDRFIGLRGTEEETRQLTRKLGIVHQREAGADPQEQENYLVDHSAAFWLIGPAGTLQAKFSAPHNSGAIARDYQRIVAQINPE